jgi:hypothetical protein
MVLPVAAASHRAVGALAAIHLRRSASTPSPQFFMHRTRAFWTEICISQCITST